MLLLLLLAAGGAALAQQPGRQDPVRPSAGQAGERPDTLPVRPDTLRADTAAADTTSFAARPVNASADSILQALRGLPGFTVTEYQSETAEFRASDGRLRLIGGAEVARQGDRLQADTIVYHDRLDLVEAFGRPRVSGQQQELEGNVLLYDLSRRRATALGARTIVAEAGSNWFVRGDVTIEGEHRVYARDGSFTTCDLAVPHYHFESDRILVIRDRILVARPARLYFGNVPVMVLPFVVQNLERGRRSGFLTPRFGVNDIVRTSSGYNRQISDVGWYWAINDYLGAQVSGSWRSGAYTALNATTDFNWRRQFLNGNVTANRFWRDGGGTELGLSGNAQWRPDERTNLGVQGSYFSSSQFLGDITYDPREQTQDLTSTFQMSRRFDWGSVSGGAERRQSISDGRVRATFPSFSIAPRPVTLFRAPSPEDARWFNNVTFNVNASGSRSYDTGGANVLRRLQDSEQTSLRASQSLTIGNLSISSNGNLGQSVFRRLEGQDTIGNAIVIPQRNQDRASWSSAISYRQQLMGTTSFSPNVQLNQEFVRDTLTGGEYVSAPMRLNFGTGFNTDLYGFFPGVGPFTTVRHRFSPRFDYRYAPEVEQTELQRRVFGAAGGRAQNIVSVGLNQTFEARLRTPRPEAPQEALSPDTLGADSARVTVPEPVPLEPQKVTILSLDTSPIQYDFMRAAAEGNGFITDRVSNTISSDYLRGLTVRIEHELFDRRGLDPANPETRGELGSFAPRLSSLSTGFELSPSSAIFRWLGFGSGQDNPATQGAMPGFPQTPARGVGGAFTGNPQGFGGTGEWRAGIQYQYSRSSRIFGLLDDEPIQTLATQMSFPLSPGWAVTWNTDFSITDREFGGHQLNFRRDLHRWQANFSYYQAPNGNSSFEFYVELLDNRDLRFDHRERNLGVDRRR